ncbi:MAG: toprim domain-containing protein [Nitrospirota bacterium]
MSISRQRGIPSIKDTERAERLKGVIEALCEINTKIPVIVEGRKDAAALRRLGLVGEIITLHNGKSLYDFCTDITERFHRVIIMLDWDEKGESLNKAISKHLRGQWEEFSSFRVLLRMLCQKDISDIEGIPKLIRRLEGDESPWY